MALSLLSTPYIAHEDHLDGLTRLTATLSEIGQTYGLDSFLAAHFPTVDRSGLLENLITSNWTVAAQRDSDRLNQFKDDPLVVELRGSIVPVVVCKSWLTGALGERREIRSSLLRVGDGGAVGFAPHDVAGRRYIVLFAGQRPALAKHVACLVYATLAALDEYVKETDLEPEHTLTNREVSCLEWAAAGKSSAEIAIILSLSEHTVNGYFKSATTKLNCVSRMQAIAVACKRNII